MAGTQRQKNLVASGRDPALLRVERGLPSVKTGSDLFGMAQGTSLLVSGRQMEEGRTTSLLEGSFWYCYEATGRLYVPLIQICSFARLSNLAGPLYITLTNLCNC